MSFQNKSVLHVCSREIIRDLRDQILRLHGFEVASTLSLPDAPKLFQSRSFDLVLLDVDDQRRVFLAEQVCEDIRHLSPHQKIAFVCNYLVSIESDCPDEIIHADFNPAAFVEGVSQLLN